MGVTQKWFKSSSVTIWPLLVSISFFIIDYIKENLCEIVIRDINTKKVYPLNILNVNYFIIIPIYFSNYLIIYINWL